MNRGEAIRLLKVEESATQEEIRSAYRDVASRLHPDLGGDSKEFARLQQAYELLTEFEPETTISNPTTVDADWMPGVPPKPKPTPPPLKQSAEKGDHLKWPARLLIAISAAWMIFTLYLTNGNLFTHVDSWMFLNLGAIVIVIGSVSMLQFKSWTVALLGAIVACVPCVSPFFIAGLPFGLWAIYLLTEKDIRQQFKFR